MNPQSQDGSNKKRTDERDIGAIAMQMTRKYQGGGEIVEFAITLMLWITVFFLIIDISLAMYNKAAITNITRYAARQGSLFWEHPDEYSVTTPIENKKLKQSMIDTAINAWSVTVLKPGSNPVLSQVDVTGDDVDPSWGNGWAGVANATVSVKVDFGHIFIGITNLLGVGDWSLEAKTVANMEARL